ncbi:MAG: TatD family hydrolase [Erysipelotrichales bacterium]|nr:TatD family hydrolase [Erysipelotrichales bacterium]
MLFDTHCHLNSERYEEIKTLIESSHLAGIAKMIVPGYDLKSSYEAKELSEKYPFIYPAFGIHPSETDKITNMDLESLTNLASNHFCVAIGEAGLDYYWQKDNKAAQIKLFKFQIELALSLDKPIIVHMRDSVQDCYDIISSYKGKLKGVMHCYSGSLEMAEKFIELGLYISIAGPVTYKNAKEAVRVVENIDFNYLLIETDCPYLTPEPLRGKINEPRFLEYTAKKIAEIRNIPFEEVSKITFQNALRCFGLDKGE